ncbi:MAG: peptidase C15 [Leptolyngbya foveolarum]|uniref:Peptidase C15 n=1 Tax=Leptolyngbya foveolarum TaxID=47253 RepID=A0A2W4TW44_9CYAN|nr:MAG: peptidase C15 [Leptolyngbya foveolarum]
MSAAGQLPERTIWLSQVPVSFAIAPIRVINAMYRFRPRAVVCCGMAEKRAYLSLEQQGKGTDQNLQTCLNLADLLMDTRLSKISDDAGDYVCNTLYYRVLEAIQAQAILHRRGSANATPCLFVHVPVLSASTQALIQSDMHSVLNKVSE